MPVNGGGDSTRSLFDCKRELYLQNQISKRKKHENPKPVEIVDFRLRQMFVAALHRRRFAYPPSVFALIVF
jgi:hypothetical protein